MSGNRHNNNNKLIFQLCTTWFFPRKPKEVAAREKGQQNDEYHRIIRMLTTPIFCDYRAQSSYAEKLVCRGRRLVYESGTIACASLTKLQHTLSCNSARCIRCIHTLVHAMLDLLSALQIVAKFEQACMHEMY